MESPEKFLNILHCIVVSTSSSHFEAHAGLFRLLMKGIFNASVLSAFDKKSFFELVTLVNTSDFTVLYVSNVSSKL